jgi:hypothetical protein
MSEHQEWKMIHLLFGHARRVGDRRVLTEDELRKAGVHCENDTLRPLELDGIVARSGNEYELPNSVAQMIRHFTVGLRKKCAYDIRVDYPDVFIVMPFSESWSDDVYTQMMRPGVEDAKFEAVRGDTIVRIGDLNTNLWQQITQAGVIVADVSAPNPNVYFEIGLADALGKPIFIFKQDGIKLPADFGGQHYYSYDLKDLTSGRHKLADELTSGPIIGIIKILG